MSYSSEIHSSIEDLCAALGSEGDVKDGEHYLSSSEFARKLYAKAGPEFFQQYALSEVLSLTRDALNFLQKFLNQSSQYYIRSENTDRRTRFFVAIWDRPFVINSVREALLDYRATIHTFLHPILLDDGKRISFSMIELGLLTPESRQVLERRIRGTLEHVHAATEDFTSMLIRAETLARSLDSKQAWVGVTSQEREELSAFLKWLIDGGFIFLGYLEWKADTAQNLRQLQPTCLFGIPKLDDVTGQGVIAECRQDLIHFDDEPVLSFITKLRSESLVQRRNRLTSLTVRESSSDGRSQSFHSFIGLFTSKALTQESSTIPLVREKLKRLLTAEMVLEQSHDYKFIANIIDSMPKDEALRMSVDDLQATVRTALAVHNREDTRISIRIDAAQRGVTVLIVLPRDRFNSGIRKLLQDHIEKTFQSPNGSSEYFLDLSNKPHARIYFQLPLPERDYPSVNVAQLEAEIIKLTRSWSDNLEELIGKADIEPKYKARFLQYVSKFPVQYQALHTPAEAFQDLSYFEGLSKERPLMVAMDSPTSNSGSSFSLIVYSLFHPVTISRAFPILENAGLEVIQEQGGKIEKSPGELIHIHRFLVEPKTDTYVSKATFDQFLAPGLEKIFLEEADNDPLNSLLITANLELRSIALLRAYCSLLWQVSKFATKSVLLDALASYPQAASQLWNMFEIRFHPEHSGSIESRNARFQSALTLFKDGLRSVTDITRDRALRVLADLLQNTVRTNFFQNSSAIALKIHSQRVEAMPQPRPLYEIFIHSREMEGVHLRAGRIARGGIRWSDRHQDFRTEVLGLMKTQNIKNALIVPSGAKGGFIVRNLPTERDQQLEAVQNAYKIFIRSLLSITDNRVDEEIKRPDRVLAYDEPDPYLVVAADKGTATFSDLANSIAEKEYSFWLGDAFASGGSQGYDHKLYGITAKGAWESVERHFKNIGLQPDDSISAIGIGDMSGDVFGNGMLLSRSLRLIAAFNHRHIFIDPNPDPEKSYLERKRLFELKHSQWTDYDSRVLSEGAGIYHRFDKEISLSPSAREALGIDPQSAETIDGETLIHLILKAPVDLLWNGGIGTYVKARGESHSDVNDGTNDRVRVNADELRCKIIGEGGNLGLTQRARIEFSRRGGHLHTDAIDNSGGVDLSDHEVNLKILLKPLVIENKISLEQRNDLLRKLASPIVADVLRHNRNHAIVLTLGVRRSRKSIDYFQSLLRELVKRGYVNRQLEFLPEDDELLERANKREGLCKPELAVCLAGVKMWVKDELTKSNLPNDPLLNSYLLSYFPHDLQESYASEILAHPLRQYIISTQTTNVLVDMMGVTFVHRMCLSHSASPITVVKCALAAEMILGGRELRKSIEPLDTVSKSKTYLQFVEDLNGSLRDVTSWLISTHGEQLTLNEMVELYRPPFLEFLANCETALDGLEKSGLEARKKRYLQAGLPEEQATIFATLSRTMLILEILWASLQSKAPVADVAQVSFFLMQQLGIHVIMPLESAIETDSKWDYELLMMSFRHIRRNISLLALRMVPAWSVDKPEQVLESLHEHLDIDLIQSLTAEIKSGEAGVAALAVLSQHLAPRSLMT